MRRIYSTASSCIVYLGEHHGDSTNVMQFFNQDSDLRQTGGDISKALTTFFKRPYFTRTWILQELVSSKNINVYCGDMATTWRQIIAIPWDVMYPTVEVPSWVQNFEITSYKQPLDFPRWIFEAGPLAASDARDKIFAILGLFDGLDSLGFIPDYSLSMTQVYTGVAAYLLQNQRMKHILTLNTNPRAGLPSWVPDWRCVKPVQWDKDLHVSNPLSIEIARRWPSTENLIRFSLLGVKCKPMVNCNSHDKLGTIRVHQHSGGLLIAPMYLIPIREFLEPSQDASYIFKGPWKWEFVSSNPCYTLEDYVGRFDNHDFWYLLRKVTDAHTYRIIGHCDLCTPSFGYPGLFRIYESPKALTPQKEFDPVQCWVLRSWSDNLWHAYQSLPTETSNYQSQTMSIQDQGRRLSMAYSEYLSLRIYFSCVATLLKSLAAQSSTTKQKPQASQLADCIRFWSHASTRDFSLALSKRPEWVKVDKVEGAEENIEEGEKSSVLEEFITGVQGECKFLGSTVGIMENMAGVWDIMII